MDNVTKLSNFALVDCNLDTLTIGSCLSNRFKLLGLNVDSLILTRDCLNAIKSTYFDELKNRLLNITIDDNRYNYVIETRSLSLCRSMSDTMFIPSFVEHLAEHSLSVGFVKKMIIDNDDLNIDKNCFLGLHDGIEFYVNSEKIIQKLKKLGNFVIKKF